MSGAKSVEEVEAWISENGNSDNLKLEDGIKSSKADVCSWLILNILVEASFTVGTLLTQRYSNEKYKDIFYYDTTTKINKCTPEGFTYFAHYLINLFNERCKYSIDKLLVDNDKKCSKKMYSSIFCNFLPDVYASSIEELEQRVEKQEDIFPF